MMKTMNSHLGMLSCLLGISKRKGWSMHMWWQHGLFLSNQTSELITWNDSAPTMEILEMIDEVVSRLHYRPCPNKKVVNESIDEIIYIFWKEFKHFIYRTGRYRNQSIWFENDDALSGRSYLWHEMHSLPFTEVLGFVACQTTSKHFA